MSVEKSFTIPKSTLDDISTKSYKFGFNGFGELVYYTNYSRSLSNGRQEHWIDTCTRVVEGVLNIRKFWYKTHDLKWDNQYWTDISAELLYYIYTLKILPPGRGLWAQGTDYVYERGSMALNNCAATLIESDTFAEDLGWVMDALMCGTGVGVRPVIDESLRDKLGGWDSFTNEWVIPDSREGWVESVIKLINSYRKTNPNKWVFNYLSIREKGEIISGFGGVSSGPEPLILLHDRIRIYMKAFIEGSYDYMRLTANIVNAIGACIIAGNVRRSAEIILGSPYNDTFRNLTNYTLYPERAEIGWMSNNSNALETDNDFYKIDEIAQQICERGEGGLVNFKNIQKFNRFGEIIKPDKATCINPCFHKNTAIFSKRRGLIKIKDVEIGENIWSAEGWTTVVAKYNNGVQDIYKYTTSKGAIHLTKDHKILEKGLKIKVSAAKEIDTIKIPKIISDSPIPYLNPQNIIDGLVMGDGTNLKGCNNRYLYIGEKDKDYFKSEIRAFILNNVDKNKGLHKVVSSLSRTELQLTYLRSIPDRFMYSNTRKIAGFLRGLFSANGDALCTSKTHRVSLRATSRKVIEQVQIMLSCLGIKSYVTIDKKKLNKFNNGSYKCKESYKVNITGQGILRFKNLIGFIQIYKTWKLDKIVSNKKEWRDTKNFGKITASSFYIREEVYDITVSNSSHTFWANGFNVSNCGEIPLENKELCNLFEVYPAKAKSKKEFLTMCRLAAIYTTSISLLPTHNVSTNQVIARNRRIGSSLSGVADWFDCWGGAKIIRFMREGYGEIRNYANYLNDQAGVPHPIRVTTVKPSGSVSQLSGVSPGMHFPLYTYALRRMRLSNNSPVLKLCEQAGLKIEDDVNNKETTKVIEYPIYTGKTRPSHNVTAWEQFSLLALLQREWSDNSVSCTIHFTEDEKKDIPRMLAYFLPVIKSCSFLLKKEGMYPQMPYEQISGEEFIKRNGKINKIDWSQLSGSDGKESKFCSNDSCEI